MKTIVYLIRHSEPLKDINNIINNDNLHYKMKNLVYLLMVKY